MTDQSLQRASNFIAQGNFLVAGWMTLSYLTNASEPNNPTVNSPFITCEFECEDRVTRALNIGKGA